MNEERLKARAIKAKAVIDKYNSTGKITNFELIPLLNEIDGGKRKLTMCAPCLKRYYQELLRFFEATKHLLEEKEEAVVEEVQKSQLEVAQEKSEEYVEEQPKKRKRGRPKKVK